jgi:hypothetical protein
MNAPTESCQSERSVRYENGFSVYELRNRKIQVAVVPELGARIISVKNLRTDREWMWHPSDRLKLFCNHAGDDFSKSPLAGLDECLPTIAPCAWQGRKLPDHGEVWSASWTVDEQAWDLGVLRTSVELKISPFDFERTIELLGDEIRLAYRLSSRSNREEQFIWAMHPLLRLCPGDKLVLPASTRALLNDAAWLDSLDSGLSEQKCSKLFAQPVTEGFAIIRNEISGDQFEFRWSPAQNNSLGLWLTRGGWHGHHHFAMEPSNADHDALTEAAARKHCGVVAAGGSASWQVQFLLRP